MGSRWWWIALAGLTLIAGVTAGLGEWQTRRGHEHSAAAAAERLHSARAEIERSIAADLELRSGWLAGDPATGAYIADSLASGAADVASISDLLGERREQLGLDTVGLIDIEGRWVAGTRPWLDSGGKPAGHRLFQIARETRQAATGLVREEERVFLGTIAPMQRAGNLIAYAYAGKQLDAALLQRLSRLVPAELALVDDANQPRLWAGSGEHPPEDWFALLAPGAQPAWQAPLFGDEAGARWLALEVGVDASEDRLPLWIAGSALGLIWLVFCGVGWGRVVRPIDVALGLLERAAAGDFHLRAPAWPAGARGRFAAAFDVLMHRIGAR